MNTCMVRILLGFIFLVLFGLNYLLWKETEKVPTCADSIGCSQTSDIYSLLSHLLPTLDEPDTLNNSLCALYAASFLIWTFCLVCKLFDFHLFMQLLLIWPRTPRTP